MPRFRESQTVAIVKMREVATLVGHRLGMECNATEILASGRRSVIRLQPAPVVAKIAAASEYRLLAAELALARHVVAAGGPAVPPLPGPAAGPHREAEFAVTLWRYVPSLTPPSDTERAAAVSYCQLREALDSYAGHLPDYTVPILECARGARSRSLAGLAPSQIDLVCSVLDGAPRRLAALGAAPCPLHGDPHLGNLLFTKEKPLWLDFESACRGPIEWDLSALPGSARLPRHDTAALAFLRQVRSACVVVWCSSKDPPSTQDQGAVAFHIARLEEAAPGAA